MILKTGFPSLQDGQKAGEGATGGESGAVEENFFGDGIDVAQIIGQLQAQIQQVQAMVNNASIPAQARHQAQLKHQQLQMELQQAQEVAAMAAAQSFSMPPAAMGSGMVGGAGMGVGAMGGAMGGGNAMGMQGEFRQWTNPFPNQQPAGQDSAYQRLPLNNRRRPLKRDRPSDFLEIGGSQGDAKTPRYWE